MNIPTGAANFLTITVSGTVAPATIGNLVNTATVTAGAGQTDLTPGNNSATDTDTPILQTNLGITKTDGSLSYVAGNPITYTIIVTNAGPSNATGASIADAVPAALTGTTINCAASGIASCGTDASAGNNLSFTGVNISTGAGNFLTITVSGTVAPATTGNLVNTATVTAGAGQTDPVPGNNTATDTDALLSADLQITKTDNATDYAGGISIQYSIVVSNAGPGNVTGATVADTLTLNPNLTGVVSWTCTASAGASCTASGAGDINDTVNLVVGSSVSYTVNATSVAAPASNLVNTATVGAPVGITELNPLNNSATDTDQLVVSTLIGGAPYGNIGTTNDSIPEFIPTNTTVTLAFATPLVVGGHASWDLVYYEWPQGTGIQMDAVILQISDGRNWYTILNWGDGLPDANTDIPIPLAVPPNPTDCTGEPDNCVIDGSLLTYVTGVAIQLDGVVPAGSYPYIRIISPPILPDSGDGVEVDAITILP